MLMRGLRRLRFSPRLRKKSRAFRRGFFMGALALAAGCRSARFPEYPSDYREFAYVANAGGATVAVLDLVSMRRVSSLAVAPHPVALRASKIRNEVYALSQGQTRGELAVIDAEQNRVAARLPAGTRPVALALAPNGEQLYAANAGSNTVSVVDLAPRRTSFIASGGLAPSALAVSPDGGTLAVSNQGSANVALFSLRQGAPPRWRGSFGGCAGAAALAILPDSSKVFAACGSSRQVMVLGLRRTGLNRAQGGLASEQNDRLLALLDVGEAPSRLVLKPDGGEIFVLNRSSDTISEIATEADEVGGAYAIGKQPYAGVVSADNGLLWVTNQAADTVAVYSIDDGKLVNTVHVGAGPGPLAFSADGHLLLAADTRSGDVSVLRTFERNLHREPVLGALFTLLPSGPAPAAIAVKAFRLRR